MFAVRIKPGVAERIVWSQGVPPAVCSVCHGALPEVPFQLLKAGHTASFCDPCADKSLDVRPTLKGPSR